MMTDQNYKAPFNVPEKLALGIMDSAIKVARSVKVDMLDCSKSWSRQPTKKTVDEVLAMARSNHGTKWNFIHRAAIAGEPERFDVGCSTGGSVAYFLWIDLPYEQGLKIIEQFGLRPNCLRSGETLG